MSILAIARSDIAKLASLADYHEAVRQGFLLQAVHGVKTSPPMELPAAHGAFHVKGAIAEGGYAAVKTNGNFPGNPARLGLPTIQGTLVLLDAENGSPLAIMDSGEVTLRRTAAASAIAVDLLAMPGAETLLIWGCGVQGRAHAEAIAPLRQFRRILFHDVDAARAERLAGNFGPIAASTDDPARAAGECDVIVTTTTAQAPLALPDTLKPGAFIAAVGADNPHKNEISPLLMARAAVVTDVTEQCVVMGDLRAAIASGEMRPEDVRGELCNMVAGKLQYRKTADEIIIYDSTGAAFQDLTAAKMIYERAVAKGIGVSIDLQR